MALDENSLFYLRTRGLRSRRSPPVDYAFSELVNRIAVGRCVPCSTTVY
jgi:hypothetical protein